MPPRIPRPCKQSGCNGLTIDRSGCCDKHKHSGWEDHQVGRSAAQRGYGSAWRKLRKLIINRDKGLCQEHQRRGQAVVGNDVDHIKAKSQGGTDAPSNLELLCTACHRSKTAYE